MLYLGVEGYSFRDKTDNALTSSRIINDITRHERFAFVKINHGLWERLARLENLESAGITDADELERRTGQRPEGADGNFLHDLRAALARIPHLGEDFFFSATPYAWPSSHRIEGTPSIPLDLVTSVIDRYVPRRAKNADGLIWKAAVYDGWFASVIEALRSRSVVLVGPHWLRNFGIFAGFRDFVFFEIHESRARHSREEIYRRLYALCEPLSAPVILLSAGHLSPLITIELLEKLPDATFLDMGVSLDICHVPTIAGRNWAVVRRADVSATIEAIHPNWADDERAFTAGASLEERRAVWLRFSQGTERIVTDTMGLTPRRSRSSELDRADLDADRVPFVEPKTPDWSRIADLCMISRRQDRWANFGPVTTGLGSVLQTLMGIPEDRVVIPASSATAALHAVVGAHAIGAGRPLIWAISAFGFPSTATGPLAQHVRVVDCDREGFLDLEELAKLDPNSWDGIIVTNLFGTAADFSRYHAFCGDRHKALVIDSALAFEGARGYAVSADEVVSFHHTKPWGFGEGGCAIVSRETAQSVRDLLNFGVETDSAFDRFATNGKMSDLAAAAILERLERMPSWSTFYRMQHNRMHNLAVRAGVSLLGPPPSPFLRGHMPVLAPNPIDLTSVPRARFDVRKYYRPLGPGCPIAEDLFGRILNIPCHPGMAAVPTAELEAFFSAIAAGHRA